MNKSLNRRLLAEFLGSAFLAAVVIGSGIAAQRLSPGDVIYSQTAAMAWMSDSVSMQTNTGGGLFRHHGLVNTHGPSAVTATVCSKCAEYFPSSVTAVHLSGLTRLPGFPAFTMGSIASTMPSLSRGFSLRRST